MIKEKREHIKREDSLRLIRINEARDSISKNIKELKQLTDSLRKK